MPCVPMTSALAGIALTFFLGLSSLAVVLLRVSPLTAPGYALTFFFLSIFAALASVSAFLLAAGKSILAAYPVSDAATVRTLQQSKQIVGSSLREGIFFALATCLVLFLWLLHILNWWIALLVYAVFILIEAALGRS